MLQPVDVVREFRSSVNDTVHPIAGWTYSSTDTEFISRRLTVRKHPTITPNFNALRRAGGLLPMGRYYAETTDDRMVDPFRVFNSVENIYMQNGASRVLFREKTASYWRFSAAGDHFTIPSLTPFLDRARRLAIAKTLTAIKQSNFNGAIALAESEKLNTMIARTTGKLASSLRFLRKGELKNAGQEFGLAVSRRQATRYRAAMSRAKDPASIENVLASGIVQIQYGVRPALNDIFGACELLASKQATPLGRVKKGVAVFLNETRNRTLNTSYNAYGPYTVEASCHTEGFVRVDYTCIYGETEAGLLHTAAQLGLTNPASVAWEVLPWSFVIDWFLPVGQFIATLDSAHGLNFNVGCVTTTVDVKHRRSQAVSGFVESYGSDTYTTKTCTREVLTDFPVPVLPVFKNPASFQHALNGIALLQLTKKRLTRT